MCFTGLHSFKALPLSARRTLCVFWSEEQGQLESSRRQRTRPALSHFFAGSLSSLPINLTLRRRSVSSGGSFGCVRVCLVRAPRGASIFPLVVGQLFDLRPIVAHDKDLAIRLRACVGIECLIFESHPAAREHNPFAVGRPTQVGVVALGVSQLGHMLTVRTNRENFKIKPNLANECD